MFANHAHVYELVALVVFVILSMQMLNELSQEVANDSRGNAHLSAKRRIEGFFWLLVLLCGMTMINLTFAIFWPVAGLYKVAQLV